MTNPRSSLALVVLVSALAGACAPQVRFLDRGHVVPYDELRAREGRLRPLARAKIESGQLREGFHVLEVYKSLAVMAFEGTGAPSVVAQARPRAPAAPAGETRGLTASVQATVEPPSGAEPTGQRTEAFWAHQALVHERTELSRRRGVSSSTLSDMFVVTSVEELQRRQRTNDLTLSFFVSDDAVYVYAISPRDFEMHALDIEADALRRLTRKLLDGLRAPSTEAWRSASRDVYDALLGRLEPALGRAERITVIPDAFIANVPFSVLLDERGVLLTDRVGIHYLPSASFVGEAVVTKPPDATPRALVVGDPIFSGGLPALPQAEVEARVVARMFDDATLLVGSTATEQRVLDTAALHNVIHLATHGYLAPTGAGDSGLFLTASATADGRLTTSEVASLDLSATYLTVLSACETSTSGPGTPSLSGLTAAFLSAGTPTVVGSQWQVPDDSTAELMVAFYERFLRTSHLEALRLAQRSVRSLPGYEHPFHWAAFVLYGAPQ